jgi:hypothetical protein
MKEPAFLVLGFAIVTGQLVAKTVSQSRRAVQRK